MKILFFVMTLNGGGAEKVLVDLVRNLNKSKFEITVFSLFNEGVYTTQIKEVVNYKYFIPNIIGYPFLRKHIRYIIFKFLKFLPSNLLHSLIIREKYDIEISYLEGISTKIISGASKNTKKIAWVHTDLYKFPWSVKAYLNQKLEIQAYKNFDEVICVSNSVKKSFEKKFNINAKVQFNVINDKEIILKGNEPVRDGRILKEFQVITVGRLIPQKGYDRLLKVHKKLMDEGINYRLLILGEGPERKQLEKYISENKLEDSVELLGFQMNPHNFIKNSNLFVCSSRVEGFSTVTTEAIILGVPVVTTECPGMNDLLGSSEYGLITENSEEGLYKGMKEILTNEDLLNHYKNKAIIRGEEFKLAYRIKEYEEIFENLVL